jgi:hypothetical protein
MKRRAARIDSNQNEIVAALRKIPGVSVAITSALGDGYPDLNIGREGKTFLVELKNGLLTPSKRKLSPDEEKFMKQWRGHYAVCNSLDEVLKVIGVS